MNEDKELSLPCAHRTGTEELLKLFIPNTEDEDHCMTLLKITITTFALKL